MATGFSVQEIVINQESLRSLCVPYNKTLYTPEIKCTLYIIYAIVTI